jgi:nitric oxide synthase oxygenase domain/subunit
VCQQVIKTIGITNTSWYSYHVNIIKEVSINVPACEYFKTVVWL